MYPLGLALLTLQLGSTVTPNQPEAPGVPHPRIVPLENALLGQWRGQEEDVIVDLEFTADHTLLIRHGSKEVIRAFQYAVKGNVLTLKMTGKPISRQYFQIKSRPLTLTFRPVKAIHSESIDLLYELPFHRVL